jgi:hypothetical protein
MSDLYAVSHCPNCGDFLFNGRHEGNVERWCRELSETKNPECETENPGLVSAAGIFPHPERINSPP